MAGSGQRDSKEEGCNNISFELAHEEFVDISLSGDEVTDHFRFADTLDIILMSVGSLSLMSIGVAVAFNILNFGSLISKFIIFETPNLRALAQSNNTLQAECAKLRLLELSDGNRDTEAKETMRSLTMAFTVNFCAVGVYILIAAYLGITFWTWTGERQVRRIRTAYFKAVMRQSVGWFDEHKSGELNSHMVEDVEKLNYGFGNKMALFIQWSSTSVSGFLVAMSVCWRLSLVTSATCPLYIAVLMLAIKYIKKCIRRELEASAKAGAVIQETFSSIKTVAAFGGEQKAEQSLQAALETDTALAFLLFTRLSAELNGVQKDRSKKAAAQCVLASIISFAGFCLTALALWYGGKLVREECMAPGIILKVFFGILTGTLYMGSAAPLLENLASASTTAEVLFSTIDDCVEIDSSSCDGVKVDSVKGEIEFKNVSFSYPARKEIKV
ncbi:multidrug resistance protein 2-like [Watersipora subatra]|uniref:multidrug resistance protein 2-like n=1 Tax=Watersipora subatra TaxID=2589382 RepID=UPI00355BA927